MNYIDWNGSFKIAVLFCDLHRYLNDDKFCHPLIKLIALFKQASNMHTCTV